MVTNGGLSNQALIQSYIMESAISHAGYAVTPGTTAPSGQNPGSVKLAGGSDDVVGLAYASTKDRQTEVAGTNKLIGIIPLMPGLEVEVPIVSDNAAISYGERLAVTADATKKGQFDAYDATGVDTGLTCFMVANEAKGQNLGGFIKARIVPQIEAGQLAAGAVAEGYLADDAVTADKIATTLETVTIGAGTDAGTATVVTGDTILGVYPISGMDKVIESVAIVGTTLTVTLTGNSTAEAVVGVVVLKASA
jgi:hypothetical protein